MAVEMMNLNTGRYSHLILTNPELTLTSSLVTQPNIVTRALGAESPLGDDDVGLLWSLSPMSRQFVLKSNVLILTSRDEHLNFIISVLTDIYVFIT